MLRILFCLIPFYVCLFWFIAFVTHYRKSDAAKRILTWFLFTCVLLYLCHALFFTVGLPHPMECLWTLCSLSVYPLYYAYICNLVSHPQCPAQTFSHPSARNHGGRDEILLSRRGGGQRAQTALCRPGIHGSIFRLPQAPCL